MAAWRGAGQRGDAEEGGEKRAGGREGETPRKGERGGLGGG